MTSRFLLVAVSLLVTSGPILADPLTVTLRSRTQPFKGSEDWSEVALTTTVKPEETALVLCDIWDKHWCESATKRCDVIAKRAAEVAKSMRAKGVFVVHCPSDTMDYYKGTMARKRMQDFTRVEFPKSLNIPDPPLPIDDKDGGCDDATESKMYRAWSRQHPAIEIDEAVDGVSDNGQEVYNALRAKGVKTLFVMGVHTNMCVLHRGFAIKQMTRAGLKCVLIRDVTDSMYNPKSKPNVTHDEGTQLVIQHIEKFWCPTCLSAELMKKAP